MREGRKSIRGYPMSRIALLLSIALAPFVVASGVGVAGETGRIKRKPPDVAEAERVASEIVMNDSLLRKGDIVATDRGFFVFRGVAADGYTYEFSPVPSPIPLGPAGR
jgi:hypothetical protein